MDFFSKEESTEVFYAGRHGGMPEHLCRKGMDPLGKSPIPLLNLIVGKVAMVWSIAIPFVDGINFGAPLFANALAQTVGIVVYAWGTVVIVLAFVFLGNSVSVGLPREDTELKTDGVYRISRNPMYLGVYTMCAGSCLSVPGVLNLVLIGLTVGIHHQIVLKEERFLEERFGLRWLEYRQRVPRYLRRV